MPLIVTDAMSRSRVPVAVRTAALVTVLGLGPVGAAASGQWACPADPLTGEGLMLLNVRSFGATGDGETDDRDAIQGAILIGSLAGGAVVYLPAGTYRTVGALRMRSGIILQGDGPESAIVQSIDAHNIRYFGEESNPVRDTAIRDLQLRGPGFKSKGSSSLIGMDRWVENARIERCLFVEAAYDAWYAVHECHRICVLDNHVIGGFDDGFNPGGMSTGNGTHDILVRGNLIEGVAQDGIHVSDNAHDIVVVENTIVDCGFGIGLYRSFDTLIQDNVITGCERGIATHSLPDAGMELIENEITDVADWGIRLIGENCVVAGNTVRNSARGIWVDSTGGVIIGNVVEDCPNGGLFAMGGAATTDAVVLDNDIRGVVNGLGIHLNAVCSTVMGNFVRDAVVSIYDLRGFNRIAGNDVDGIIYTIPGDIDCDERVDVADILALLAAWGECDGPAEDCRADIDGSGDVGFSDLLSILENWSE